MFKEIIKNKKFIFLLSALVLVIPFEILSFMDIYLPDAVEIPFFIILIAIIGRKVFYKGVKSLLKLKFSSINLLMTIAVFGAVYLQQFAEAAIIVILFSLGEALENFGIDKSKSALQELINKNPKSVQLKGKEEKTAIEEVKIGDVFIVKHGDHIALDGEIISGESLLDESSITGEPLPKSKFIGDLVYSGSVNGEGYLEVKVTKEAKDTTLSKIIKLTYEAAAKKSESQQFIDKFAKYYTPAIMLIAFLVFFVPVVLMGQDFTKWFTEALTLLIISCPCALVISTPVGVFSAIGNATKKGILIKGGKFLEEMGRIQAIAFDKTRTLTIGEPVVSDVIALKGHTQEGVLSCIAGLEAFSEHPVSRSITQKAKELGLDAHAFSNFKAVAGKGVKGTCMVCTNAEHTVGNLKFLTDEKHPISDEVINHVQSLESQGKTAIVVSDGNDISGVIGVTDEIRSESAGIIQSLKQLNIIPVILTGDNLSSAQYVAQQVGIDEIHASLLPEEKVNELKKLEEKYKSVAMVGDGVNDAPSLAQASVGIAMGAVGSDVAIENADIALMNDKLSLISYIIAVSRKMNRIIKFNIIAAVATKVLFLVLAVTGHSNLALAIFADVGVTVFVILNALRLYSYKPA
ncbi:MAG: cation-translocating P-type ATPase [Patescibacteria group bacterium]